MVYLVNEEGYIVWSFQPMGDYMRISMGLRGISCQDIDGDGLKDIMVFIATVMRKQQTVSRGGKAGIHLYYYQRTAVL